MASQVKVKVERVKIIQALEEKKKELEATPAIALSEDEQQLVALLRAAAEKMEGSEKLWDRRGHLTQPMREAWELLEQLRYADYDRRGHARPLEDPPLVRIERQLKILNLSDDDYVSVGVNDELYELL